MTERILPVQSENGIVPNMIQNKVFCIICAPCQFSFYVIQLFHVVFYQVIDAERNQYIYENSSCNGYEQWNHGRRR